MSIRSGGDTELSPAALEVLRGIDEETQKLRAADLAEAAPAAVFHAD